MMSISPKLSVVVVLSILGVCLVGCAQTPSSQATPSEGSTISNPIVAPAPDCDVTVPLNHCGAYMPQFCQSCGD
jgi:hypothetical protein